MLLIGTQTLATAARAETKPPLPGVKPSETTRIQSRANDHTTWDAQDFEKNLQRLQEKRRNTSARVFELTGFIAQASSPADFSAARHNSLKAALTVASDDLAAINARIETLTAFVERERPEIDAELKRSDPLAQLAANLVEQQEAQRESQQQLEVDLAVTAQELERTKRAMAAQSEANRERLEAEVARLTTRMKQQAQDLQEAKEIEVAKIRATFARRTDEKARTLDQVQSALTAAQADAERLRAQLERLRRENDQLSAQAMAEVAPEVAAEVAAEVAVATVAEPTRTDAAAQPDGSGDDAADAQRAQLTEQVRALQAEVAEQAERLAKNRSRLASAAETSAAVRASLQMVLASTTCAENGTQEIRPTTLELANQLRACWDLAATTEE